MALLPSTCGRDDPPPPPPTDDCKAGVCQDSSTCNCTSEDELCATLQGKCDVRNIFICYCNTEAGGGGTEAQDVDLLDGFLAPGLTLPAPGQSQEYFFKNTQIGWAVRSLLPDCRGSGAADLLPVMGEVRVLATRRLPPEAHLFDLALVHGNLTAPSVEIPCFGPTGVNTIRLSALSGQFDLQKLDLNAAYQGEITNVFLNQQSPLLFETELFGRVSVTQGRANWRTKSRATLPPGFDGDSNGAPDFCLEEPRVIYVDEGATGSGDGSSWTNAHTDLQAALDSAGNDTIPMQGVQVWVAAGTYRPSERTDPGDPRSATFQLAPGVQIFGGFSGTEQELDDRAAFGFPTVLSGDLAEDDLPGFMNRGDNAYHVVSVSRTHDRAGLERLTISGGHADGGDAPQKRGGGVRIDLGRPLIERCVLVDNYAEQNGAALSTERWAGPVISRCTVYENFSNGRGGGLHCGPSTAPIVVNSRFLGNHATLDGGAIGSFSATTTIVNSAFSGNRAEQSGGAIANLSSGKLAVVNCTLFANVAAAGSGGGVFSQGSMSSSGTTGIYNSILWDNSAQGQADELAQVTAGPGELLDVRHCCVRGWTGSLGGPANIGLNPRFTLPSGADGVAGTLDDNLRLRSMSPCINAASPPLLDSDREDLDRDCDRAEPVPWDLGGRRRLTDGLDMGAYEFYSWQPSLPEERSL